MSVHYKFKSALEYDTVTFDGLHISVKDLKKAIIHQKRIGKNTDFDLQVTNAQTKEVYTDESALIPKNTSLVIARIPLAAQTKGKAWEGYGAQSGTQSTAGTMRADDGALSKAVDLTQLDASEDDKIRAMMTQSTLDYDPSNYMKIRGSNQVGVVPAHYRCFKCHQPGHWIKDCPLGHGQEPMEIKKSTGIPRSFMVPVEGPMVPGAMMTPTGQYAVPVLDHQAYNDSHKAAIPAKEEKPEIPEDLVCSICKDLLTDAVMIPCCGNSFCDECIRTILLESEDHECPDCKEKDISPGTLIPNRFLRNSVSNFKNETGYHKRQQYRNAVVHHNPPAAVQDPEPVDTKPKLEETIVQPVETTTAEVRSDSPLVDVKAELKCDEDENCKPIISEADSTEIKSQSVKDEPVEVNPVFSPANEGPPGVETPPLKEEKLLITSGDAPPGVDSPPSKILLVKQGQAITSVGSGVNHHRVSNHMSQSNAASRGTSNSEQSRHYPPPLVPPYSDQPSRPSEERPGTPTVDEPGMGPPGYTGSDTVNYADTPPPGLHPTTTTLPPSQHMHPPPQIPGPPPSSSQPGLAPSAGTYAVPPVATHQPPPGIYPPTNGPPPAGYRMPPPGHPDFNRVGTNTGYGDGAHSLSRVLLVSNLDPSVPPPTVPPPQGPFGARPLYDPTRPPVQYDPHRPPVHGAPPPGYPPYPPGPRPGGRPYPPPRHMQPPPPGMNHRSVPPIIPMMIDDPLEAFNRMLREKDERDRRARQQRRVTRSPSYSRSRSSSRSFSRSPRSRSRSPPPRSRHRSRSRSPLPRNRHTPRSRTRSFSISRSRSFSRSPSPRGTPARDYSPRRRPPSRYRSPVNSRNSPPRYRYKDRERDRGIPSDRDRERDRDRDRDRAPERDRDRDRDRSDRDRTDRDRTDRERTDRDRDYQYYENTTPAPPVEYEFDSNYERNRQRPPLLRNPRYGVPPVPRKDYPLPETYYPPTELCPTPAYPAHTTRYNNRGPPYPPPLMSVKTVPPHGILERPDIATHRKYEEVAPPGIEQPPVPGFENQRYDTRCPPYDRPRDDGPPGVDRYQKATSPYSDREEHRDVDRPPRPEINHRGDYRDNRDKVKNGTPDKEDRFERKYSPSPDRRHKSLSPRRSPRDGVSSQDKSRRRKRDDSSDRDKRVSDSRLDHDKDKKEKKKDDEDDKSKKNKDKKKKKEKKEAERKKKKEKKEKKEQEKLKKAEEKKAKEAQECKEDDKKDVKLLEKLDCKSTSTNFTSASKISLTTISQTSLSSNLDIPEDESPSQPDSKMKVNLYDDILSEGIDNTVVENYGKIESKKKDQSPSPSGRKSPVIKKENDDDLEEKETSFDGLELQVNETELKVEFNEAVRPKANEVLAPVPEPSKWEIDEDMSTTPEKIHSNEPKPELRQVFERPGKVVTSEVIKRAENAIFAKAINAIRPIEIKKISVDRAKLYSGEKSSAESITKEPVKNIQITIPGGGWNLDDIPPPGTEPIKLTKTDRSSRTTPPPNRLSVKERLGCKVEELDKIAKDDKPFEKNRSRTLSPLSRRNDDAIRNTGVGERRVEVDDRKRDDRSRHDPKNRDRNDHDKDRKASYRNDRSKSRDRSNYRDRRTEKKDQRKDDRRDARRDNRRDDRRDDKRLERSRSRPWNDRRREDRRRDDRRDSKERDRNTREREKKSRDRNSRDRERHVRDKCSRDQTTRDKSSRDRDRNVRERDLSTRVGNTKDKDRNSRDRDKDKRRSRSNKSKSSRSESGGDREKRKKKIEKKHKKDKDKEKERDKGKKHKKDDESSEDKPDTTVDSKVVDKKTESNESKVTGEKPEKAKVLDDRRKPTLDEANFEPDYDLETESEKEDNLKVKSESSVSKKRERSKSAEKKAVQDINKKRRTEDVEKRSQRDSSTSDSSDSSSDDRHKKKHRKHKKKKSRRDSSSSSSSSESDSSVDRKTKKRHKSSKKIKKKKKSKHK